MYFTILAILIVIYFLKKLIDKKNKREKFNVISKTNEECVSFTYVCDRIIDGYTFLSGILDSTV